MRCGTTLGPDASFCPHDGTRLVDSVPPDPLIGRVLLQQFRVDEQIGSGGMGSVYRARQLNLDRDVAIKVLRPHHAGDPNILRRFEREARVATSLDHPNLVRVFLFGQLEDGRLYLVMEFLKGRTLSQLIAEEPLLEVERAVRLLVRLCAGVDAVHEQGIVHRDVKPDNIFLVQKGKDPDFVKLVDFGIARYLEDGKTSVSTTLAGQVVGTANYMSPEAAAGEPTDFRSDIYSIAVLSYQLLAGELPFKEMTPGNLLMQHVHQPAPDIRTRKHGARIGAALCDVVMQGLSKDPAARQASAMEYGIALAEAAALDRVVRDARPLLLTSVWSQRIETTPTYRASMLGSSAHSQPAIPLAAVAPEDEALMSTAPDPFGGSGTFDQLPLRSTKGPIRVLVGLLVVAAIVGGIALVQRLPGGDDVHAEAAGAQIETRKDAALDELARRAQEALDQGNYISPAIENVAELSVNMLAIDPNNQQAMSLRRRAVQRLQKLGWEALRQANANSAENLYAALRHFAPQHDGAQAVLAALGDGNTSELASGISTVPFPAPPRDDAILVVVLKQAADTPLADPVFRVGYGSDSTDIPAIGGKDGRTWVAGYRFPAAGTYALAFRSAAKRLVSTRVRIVEPVVVEEPPPSSPPVRTVVKAKPTPKAAPPPAPEPEPEPESEPERAPAPVLQPEPAPAPAPAPEPAPTTPEPPSNPRPDDKPQDEGIDWAPPPMPAEPTP